MLRDPGSQRVAGEKGDCHVNNSDEYLDTFKNNVALLKLNSDTR